jgi:predicted nucleic acid-binding Zn ribbon protein
MTIITLDDHNDQNAAALAWLDQNGPKMERRCRNVLLRELQRVQRASFMHFMLLCLIPTALLLVVVVTVFGEEEPCGSRLTTCRQEATMHSP